MVSEDVNRVARVISMKQLAKINKALKIDVLPGDGNGGNILSKVPSDDDIFDIACLDLGSNKQDAQFLNSAAAGTTKINNYH